MKNKFNKEISPGLKEFQLIYLNKLSVLKLSYIGITTALGISLPLVILSLYYAGLHFITLSESPWSVVVLLLMFGFIALYVTIWVIMDEYYDLKVKELQNNFLH